MTMATAGTDQDNLSGKSIQGTVVVSGQITPEGGLRLVLEELLEECRHIQHGVLRVLSKDVRGHIGIFCGSYIAGAHVTTTRDYGVQALKQLLGASRGMYAFLSLPEQQIELKQSLSLSIDELLNWHPSGSNGEPASLTEAVEQLASHSGRFEAISESELFNLQSELLDAGKEQKAESSFLAWGGDMPVLASNLSRLKLAPRKVDTREWSPLVEIERIPIPDDLDELAAAAANGSQGLDEMQYPAVVNEQSGQPQDYDNLDDEVHHAGWSAADLDAIPTPNRSAQSGQVDADIQRSLRDHRTSLFGNLNRSLEKPQKRGDGAPEQPETPPPMKASGRHRTQTQEDIALSALVSQRMQAVDPKAFLSESNTRSSIDRPTSKVQGKLLGIAGGVIGVVLVTLMFQQIFQVQSAARHLQSGLDALKKHNYSKASLEFSEVINNQPDSVKGYFYRASAEAKLDQPKKAIADYTKAISLDPKYILAYAGRAGARLQVQDYNGALADCEELHKLKQDFMDQYRLRAVGLVNTNQYKDAVEDATFYLDATDGNDKSAERADTFATRGYAYYKLQNLSKAAKDYTEAILLNPKNPMFYESRALVYRDMHNWRRALSDANKAVQLNPSDINVYQIRGSCYHAQGDDAKALAELEKALKLKPSPQAHKMRGEIRMAMNNYQGALDDFEYVLNVTPGDQHVKTLTEQARDKLKVKAKPTPVADVSATESSKPLTGSPTALVEKGYKLLKEGSSSEAVEYLSAAVIAAPGNINARRYLAYALLDSGDAGGAMQQFSALSSSGNLQGADRVAYGKSLVAAHKIEQAISLLQPISAAEPSNDSARIALIDAYLAAGFKDRAATLAREGMTRSPAQQAKYAELLQQTR